MNSSRSKNFSKKSPVKRDLRKTHHFQPKRDQNKERLLDLKQKQLQRFGYNVETLEQKLPENNSISNDIQSEKSIEKPNKMWWVHVRGGLVMDESGKHHLAMRQAIWLYLYLLLAANRRNGMLFRKISTIEKGTGFNRRNIGRWMKILRDQGYIETHSTGRFLQIVIKKWKPIINHHRKT